MRLARIRINRPIALTRPPADGGLVPTQDFRPPTSLTGLSYSVAGRWRQCVGARLTVIVTSRAAAALWRVVSVALVPLASRRATAA